MDVGAFSLTLATAAGTLHERRYVLFKVVEQFFGCRRNVFLTDCVFVARKCPPNCESLPCGDLIVRLAMVFGGRSVPNKPRGFRTLIMRIRFFALSYLALKMGSARSGLRYPLDL